MKFLALLLFAFLSFAFSIETNCGDGTVYANQDQTSGDKRFNSYSKIDGLPKFKGGDKKLNKFILGKMKVSDEAKNSIFNLNYQFTVTCDGKIKEVKQIGDSKADNWTNIKDIIPATEGSWTPAEKDGKPVDCIYFGTIFINGSKF